MKYVIIGNSIAAAGAVEGIRSQDPAGSVTIVSDEDHHVYSRPLISYLLQGRVNETTMRYRPDDFYDRNNCMLLKGRRATGVDADKREVSLDDGTILDYDALLLATGSRPFIPPIPGLADLSRFHTFMKLDDAKKLADDLTDTSRVLIIGAGLIGLKCAEGIHGRCARLSVADIAPHVLPSILDEESAHRVENTLTWQGVELYLGSGVERIVVEDQAQKAVLSDGREIPFDQLVVAVGVRPNTELYPGDSRMGIATDERGRTDTPGIFAAGDCATSFDISSGKERILALLPSAYMQGHAAGVNMAGGDEVYSNAIPANALGLFGVHMITAGSLEGVSHVKQTKDSYRRLVVRDGRLVGFIALGDVARSGIYTSLIRDKRSLADIDFELICEKPQLMAFSRKERARQLRGTIPERTL